MIQPLKNADGFTLLELILSMVIVGFIVAISLGAIRLGISAQEVGHQKTETFVTPWIDSDLNTPV